MRSLSDEGGRLSLSGENGWAFFDYHLAMFGPQEVPLGKPLQKSLIGFDMAFSDIFILICFLVFI
jgi:hypothetical protein